jgi:hypothetical protein
MQMGPKPIIALPLATELKMMAQEAREKQHQEWIDSIKQAVINEAKNGGNYYSVGRDVSLSTVKEIEDIFVPLGYTVHAGPNSYGEICLSIEW